MKYDSFSTQPTGTRRRRRSIRLKDYNYSLAGAYFITLVTYQRACLFGHIVDGEMELGEIGRVVEEQWLQTAEVRPNVELDEFVIMPNHFHGILIIVDDVGPGAVVGASRRLARSGSDAHGPSSGSVGAIMAQFKSMVTKHVNRSPDLQGVRVWQRNYFEHIIRNERELDRIRAYIASNPSRWTEDGENPIAANCTIKSAF